MSQFQKVQENDWADWRESPITQAFFQFMDDLAKESAGNLLESFYFKATDMDSMINNEVRRAEIRSIIQFSEELQGLTLLDIKTHYGEEITDDEQSDTDGQ